MFTFVRSLVFRQPFLCRELSVVFRTLKLTISEMNVQWLHFIGALWLRASTSNWRRNSGMNKKRGAALASMADASHQLAIESDWSVYSLNAPSNGQGSH